MAQNRLNFPYQYVLILVTYSPYQMNPKGSFGWRISYFGISYSKIVISSSMWDKNNTAGISYLAILSLPNILGKSHPKINPGISYHHLSYQTSPKILIQQLYTLLTSSANYDTCTMADSWFSIRGCWLVLL